MISMRPLSVDTIVSHHHTISPHTEMFLELSLHLGADLVDVVRVCLRYEDDDERVLHLLLQDRRLPILLIK